MLLRAPVQALKNGQIGKRAAYIVITMHHYPRYTPKTLSHEYVQALAPDATLFAEFKERERELKDHNQAFADVEYEARFKLSDKGVEELERLAKMAATKDVYLVCQCTHEQRCHTDLLLMAAQARFGTPVGTLPFTYPTFARRLASNHL